MVKHIVIIGGGFGGIYTAKHLLKKFKNKNNFKITLINRDNYFLFTPMLHEVATGGLNRHNIVEPIREILKADNFEFIKCEVKEVDFNKKRVIKGGVIAIVLGVVLNDFFLSLVGGVIAVVQGNER